MRDESHEHFRALPNHSGLDSEESLPGWAHALLLEPAASRSAARTTIMDRVRLEPRHPIPAHHTLDARSAGARTRLRVPMRPTRWNRRGLLTPFGSVAFASLLALLVGVRGMSFVHRERDSERDGASEIPGITASATVLRDTVLPVAGRSLQDAFRSGLRDTMRVVELVLRGPDVRHVAVVGDFNAWQRGATTMQRRVDGAWHAQVVVPRDVVRFAYVVNTRAATSRPSGSTRVQLDSI